MNLLPKIALQPPKSTGCTCRTKILQNEEFAEQKFCKGFPSTLIKIASKSQLPATKPTGCTCRKKNFARDSPLSWINVPPRISFQPPNRLVAPAEWKFCKGFPRILDKFTSKDPFPTTEPIGFDRLNRESLQYHKRNRCFPHCRYRFIDSCTRCTAPFQVSEQVCFVLCQLWRLTD